MVLSHLHSLKQDEDHNTWHSGVLDSSCTLKQNLLFNDLFLLLSGLFLMWSVELTFWLKIYLIMFILEKEFSPNSVC